jgi:hypothetical protein
MKSDPERFLISIWTIVKYTIRNWRKENWTRSDSFDGTIPHTHSILHPRTFGFSGGAKERRRDKPSRVEMRSKHSYSKCGQEWIPVNFSTYLTNEWRGLNILLNQEEGTLLNKNALLRLLTYLPESRRVQLLLSHPIAAPRSTHGTEILLSLISS